MGAKLNLFVSFDIVNSTKFKTRKNDDSGNEWIKIFNDNFFNKSFEELENLQNEKKEDCSIWKTLGDEIIFRFEFANDITKKKIKTIINNNDSIDTFLENIINIPCEYIEF